MTAFRATFADMKLVKTRQVAQLIFEVPIEDFDAAYEVLGGMPVPSKERWFGIAAILPEKAAPAKREKMGWREVQPAAQAALRCNEQTFRTFLMEEHSFRPRDEKDPEEAAQFIRSFFGIHSRSELSSDHRKRVLWHQLDSQFMAWQAKERVGA